MTFATAKKGQNLDFMHMQAVLNPKQKSIQLLGILNKALKVFRRLHYSKTNQFSRCKISFHIFTTYFQNLIVICISALQTKKNEWNEQQHTHIWGKYAKRRVSEKNYATILCIKGVILCSLAIKMHLYFISQVYKTDSQNTVILNDCLTTLNKYQLCKPVSWKMF